jgi:threonine aldolase
MSATSERPHVRCFSGQARAHAYEHGAGALLILERVEKGRVVASRTVNRLSPDEVRAAAEALSILAREMGE